MIHKYGTMSLEGSVGDTSDAGSLESRDDPEETVETEGTEDMGTGEHNRQIAPQACGQSAMQDGAATESRAGDKESM